MTIRALLAALLLALLPLRAQAAVAHVQSNSNLATPFQTDGIADLSFAGNTTIGNLIIVIFYVEASSRTVTSVTAGGATLSICSQGGTDANVEVATSREIWAYCGYATSATTAVQVTLSSAIAGTGDFVMAVELSGTHATLGNAIEDVAVATNNAAGDHAAGPVTTASAGSALIGAVGGSNGTYTQDADFTDFGGSPTHGNGSGGYDLLDATSASYTPTTAGVEETVQLVIAVAPPAAAGGGAPKNCLLLGVCE